MTIVCGDKSPPSWRSVAQSVDDNRLEHGVQSRANSDCEHVARSSSTCCETENFRLKVTPSILIDWTNRWVMCYGMMDCCVMEGCWIEEGYS